MKKRTTKKPAEKQRVVLSRKDRTFLNIFIKKGVHSAREITRAKILLRSHRGETDVGIAAQEGCSRTMSRDVRIRYHQHGLEAALHDRPRSGQPRKLDAKAEQHLVAVACTDPPEGADHWTLELLTERMIADKKVDSISSVAIMHYLHRNDLQPWREKNVVHTEDHARVC